jgi:hypothetical protein
MRVPEILDPAMRVLRGPYKSIRYQWITLP